VLAGDLRALLDGLAITRADLFGCSGGAITTLDFALTHPAHARRLILAEPPTLGHRLEPSDILLSAVRGFLAGKAPII